MYASFEQSWKAHERESSHNFLLSCENRELHRAHQFNSHEEGRVKKKMLYREF